MIFSKSSPSPSPHPNPNPNPNPNLNPNPKPLNNFHQNIIKFYKIYYKKKLKNLTFFFNPKYTILNPTFSSTTNHNHRQGSNFSKFIQKNFIQPQNSLIQPNLPYSLHLFLLKIQNYTIFEPHWANFS